MKKMYSLMLLSVLSLIACNKEKTIQPDDLPANASGYVTTHFASQQIIQTVKERDDLKLSYFVYLNNGTKLEFNREGEIRDIDGTTAVPNSALPSLILSYVQSHYPAAFIKGWRIGDTRQDIKLSTGTNLEFDRNGNFLRVGN
jgi:hypothetical protein